MSQTAVRYVAALLAACATLAELTGIAMLAGAGSSTASSVVVLPRVVVTAPATPPNAVSAASPVGLTAADRGTSPAACSIGCERCSC